MNANAGINRTRWRLVLAALTACLAPAAALVVAVDPAHAICRAEGLPDSWRGPYIDGSARGEVRANPDTCDGDLTYVGRLKDLRADGRGVHLYLCDDVGQNGLPWGCDRFYVGGAGNEVFVSKTDTDGEMWARLRWGAVYDDPVRIDGY